jgi:uncharacterized protein (DUF1499 family)
MNRSSRSFSSTRTDLALPLFAVACAIVSLALLISSGFGTRVGLWNFRTGFAILQAAAYIGLFSAFLSVIAGTMALRRGSKAASAIALAALICGIVTFALPLSWKLKAQRFPRIHDISTDLNHPPQFVAITPREGADQRIPATVAAQQLRAYPDLKTVVLPVPMEQAFQSALGTAKEMGWEIVAAVPQEGRIEATDTTLWFGFKDDIVIRLFPAGERTLLDMRSVSRVGVSDVGTNAARIRGFLSKMSHQPK